MKAIDAAIAEAETLLKRHPERAYYSTLGDSLRKMRKDVDEGWPVDDEKADVMMGLSAYMAKALDYPEPGDEEHELWLRTTEIEDATAEGLGRELPEEG